MKQLRLVGISFKSLPVALREEFALSSDKKENAPILLKEIFGLSEIVCLYTCNRIEFYYTSEIEIDPIDLFCYFYATETGINQKILSNIYQLSGDKVCEHLFHVICGLKSMAVGETQILHQIKNAFQISVRNGCVKKELHHLFQYAFKTAKKIHRKTNIDSIKSSISSLSVELAESLLGCLISRNILILGTGETASLTFKALSDKGIESVVFMSRSQDRALEWAASSGKKTLVIEQLPEVIQYFDVVIACADCQEPIIKKEIFSGARYNDTDKIQVLIDLGVPRNIESSIGELANVQLRNIDDLKGLIDCNAELRLREVQEASEIIADAIEKYKCRHSLNLMFRDIHENTMDDSRASIREAIFRFQNTGNFESLEDHLVGLMGKGIETSLDHFRAFANKIPAVVMNDYVFQQDANKEMIKKKSIFGSYGLS